MNTIQFSMLIMAIVSGILLFGGLQVLAPAELAPEFGSITQAFNKEACEQDCRSLFGVDPYSFELQGGRGGRGGFSYYAYARCIQECNARYWDDFNKGSDRSGWDFQQR